MCARNKDGSFATQDDRAQILHQAARTLQKAGFQNLAATSLKPKHVDLLVKSWQVDGLSAGTMKNRMSCLRWWAEKVGKQTAVVKVVVAFLLVIQAAFSVVVASFLGAVVGLRCTSSIGFQLRVEPDQRFGLALRAAA